MYKNLNRIEEVWTKTSNDTNKRKHMCKCECAFSKVKHLVEIIENMNMKKINTHTHTNQKEVCGYVVRCFGAQILLHLQFPIICLFYIY